MLSRRRFVSRALGVAALGGTLPAFLRTAAFAQPLPALGTSLDPNNVLVVIQMEGGNDGLNTVVPYSDDAYHRARPAIAIAEKSVIQLDARIGLNPVMTAFHDLYEDGRVAIVQGVGYPNPNRSHFEATQIWETASPESSAASGWLGRYLEATVPQATAGASADPATLFAGVALAETVPTALIAQHVDVPAIGTLVTFGYNGGNDTAAKATATNLYDGARPGQSPYLKLLETTARNALHGGDILRAKVTGYTPLVTYPTDPFSRQLQVAAKIIGSRLGTRIIFVSIGSFDTHAGQRAQQDALLATFSNGLRAFYADLAAHHLEDSVLAMTFSEFGRRVGQNASNGTDHGTAMPVFIIGGKVHGGIYGTHPSLTDLDQGDLKFSLDFRSVYATVLERWLGHDPSGIIDGTFDRVAFV